MQIDPGNTLLSIHDVQRFTTLSRATIYRFIAAGTFPPPIKLSRHGRVAWRYFDVLAWSENPLAWSDETTNDSPF